MADIAGLTGMIETEAQALGLALVRVRMMGGKSDPTLQVMAERPDTRQLTIDDCADLSHRLSDLLDRLESEGRDPIEEAYRLEVSSPGIDRPLTRMQDFEDWRGHEARVVLSEQLDGRKQFRGDLAGYDSQAQTITLTLSGGGLATLPFGGIADAKLVLTDRLIAATQPLSTEGAEELEDAADEDAAEQEGLN